MSFELMQKNTPIKNDFKAQDKLLEQTYIDSYNQTVNRVAIDYSKYELNGKTQEEIIAIMNSGVRNGKSRLDRLLVDAGVIFSANYNKSSAAIQETIKTGISNEYYYMLFILNSFASVDVVDIPEYIVTAATYSDVDKVIKVKPTSAVKTPFPKKTPEIVDKYFAKSGIKLMDKITEKKIIQSKRVRNIIRRGVMQGINYREMAGSIKNGSNNSFYEALRIARTEAHRTKEAGSYSAYQTAKNQGVAGTRQILSTLDDRTRDQSAQVDGLQENKDGLFVYQGFGTQYPGNWGVAGWDIHDRETTIIVLDGIEPNQRTAKDPKTGAVKSVEWKQFTGWSKEVGLKRNKYGRYYT